MNDTNTSAIFSEAMSRSFMLVHLRASMWTAVKVDKNADDMVRSAAQSQRGATRTTKYLFAGAEAEHRAVCKAINAARQDHYHVTQPWSLDGAGEGRRTGPRLLANSRFFDYTKMMQQHRSAVSSAIAALQTVYDQRREDARKSLGSLWDASEYPPADSLTDVFGIDIKFDVLPEKTDFARLRGIPDAALTLISKQVENQQQTMIRNAMSDAYARAAEVVGNMAERLEGDSTRWHNSLLTNVNEMAKLLKDFNITDDPKLESIRTLMVDRLTGLNPKSLKSDERLRKKVANDAAAIHAKLRGIL